MPMATFKVSPCFGPDDACWLLAAARPARDERKAGQRQQSDHALP